MPAGVRVWDQFGRLVFDINTNAGRGVKYIETNVNGSVTDDLLLQGVPYWAWMPRYMELPRSVTISVSGNVLFYTLSANPHPQNFPSPVIIMYGVR